MAEGEARAASRSSPTAGVYQLINNGRLAPSHPHLQLPAHEENALSMPNFGDALGGGAGGELRLQQPLASAYAVSLGQEPLFTNFSGPPSNFIGITEACSRATVTDGAELKGIGELWVESKCLLE